jgi:DNA-binding LytR/AlgR family response regulator
MRVGICDDDEIQLDYLKIQMFKWSERRQVPCEVQLFHSAEELLFEYSAAFPFDLFILDIQMGNMNGMELAKRIRTIDTNIPILFLTGISDYVYEGYEVGARRYLLKPVKEEQLFGFLNEICEEISQKKKKYYIFQCAGELLKLDFDSILLIEALGHYLKITTTTRIYEWKYNIGQILNELDSDFYQVHRSFIINLNFIEKINKTNLILSNGLSVPVSRNKYQSLNEVFIRHFKGDMLL